jgi:hypothetical protein
MKKIINNLIWSGDNRMNGLIALAIVGFIAIGCACPRDNDRSGNTGSDNPFDTSTNNSADADEALIKATIKATTAKFANAISTEDFTSLYAETAPEFQQQFTKEQLANEFRDFTRQKRQLLPILSKTVSMEPEFTETPSTRDEGGNEVLTAAGKYATTPLPVTFRYEYVKKGASWKLLKLEIYVKK